jgi:hypothetical protein
MKYKTEELFWQVIGGVLAVLSLAVVSWLGDFNYPSERGSSTLVVLLVYVLWFFAGAISMCNFVNYIKGNSNEKR